MVKVGQTHRRHDTGEARDGGAMRKRATGHGRGRAWARWRALAPACRTVRLLGRGEAGADDGELQGGGRSSGELGVGVRKHSRGCGWVLWPPGGALSTAACSVAALGNRGYGDDMAGGEELSAPTVVGVRGRKRVRGEGETTEELTWIP